MVTDTEIRNWAAATGFDAALGYQVGTAYAQSHDGQLPRTRTELCNWAATSGVRTPDGQWHVEVSVSEQTNTSGNPLDTYLPQVRAWIYQHPWETGGLALLGYFALVGLPKRRRQR